MSDPKGKESERLEAEKNLRECLKPGDTVYTVLRHVSRSGMLRVIGVIIIRKRKDTGTYEPRDISYWVGKALDYSMDRDREGLRVSGCGMDMGFHVVYSLSSHLFRDGFDCIGKGCPSNDHFNRDKSKHHREGGYALVQKWL